MDTNLILIMAGWTLTGFVIGWFVGESFHRLDSIKGTIELLRDMKYLTEKDMEDIMEGKDKR
jgi:hypothetical protein